MSGSPIGEDDLQAYVDGRLEPERQAEVTAYLDDHADIAARVAGYRRQREALRAALASVAEEPLPPELNLARMIEARHRNRAGQARWRMAAAAVLLVCLGGAGGWGLHGLARGGLVPGDAGTPVVGLAATGGIAALAQEAADSYAVYAADHVRPVELHPAERTELVDWAAQRLHRRVAVPDLSAAGYRFMGGRLVATAHGAAVLFMYDDDRGTRLVVLSRPMTQQDRNAPMAPYMHGKVSGYAWADHGLGYSLVGAVAPDRLHPLADEIRRQVGSST